MSNNNNSKRFNKNQYFQMYKLGEGMIRAGDLKGKYNPVKRCSQQKCKSEFDKHMDKMGEFYPAMDKENKSDIDKSRKSILKKLKTSHDKVKETRAKLFSGKKLEKEEQELLTMYDRELIPKIVEIVNKNQKKYLKKSFHKALEDCQKKNCKKEITVFEKAIKSLVKHKSAKKSKSASKKSKSTSKKSKSIKKKEI